MNANIGLIWMFSVLNNDFSIESVDHKFLEPGHRPTYNACDRDFGIIEKNVWIPSDWRKLFEENN